jgi:ABC-2 type transport system ATP-binding protein
MKEPVLTVKDLYKSYGRVEALKGISYSLKEHEILAVLGPNGAGKTTEINCLCGIIPFDSAQLYYRNELGRLPKEKLGLCPQELIIWKKLSLIEQLIYMGNLYEVPKNISSLRAEELLVNLGLIDKRRALAGSLSGGMKRRLNVALSLMHDPEILILDEPEAGLDPQSRILLRDFIKIQAKKRSVILTTHNMDEAERLADRLILIDHGEIIEEGSPSYMKERYSCSNLEEVFIHLTGRSLRD